QGPDRFGQLGLVAEARVLPLNIQGRRPSLQFGHVLVRQPLRDELDPRGEVRPSPGKPFQELLAGCPGQQGRAVPRIAHLLGQQSVGLKGRQLVAEFKRERAIFVEEEVEVQRNTEQFLSEKDTFLDVRLATPAPVCLELFEEGQQDGRALRAFHCSASFGAAMTVGRLSWSQRSAVSRTSGATKT